MKSFHFKIAILIRSHSLYGNVADLVNQLSAAGMNDIHLFELRDTAASSFRDKGWSGRFRTLLRLANDLVTDIIVKIEFFLVNCKRRQSMLRSDETTSSLYHSRNFIEVHRKESDGEEHIGMSGIAAISQFNADILMQLDSPKPPAGISAAATFGLLELIYSPNTRHIAPRPGFWSSYYRKNKTEFQIRHYEPGMDTGKPMLHGSFATKLLFSENHRSLLRQSNAQLVCLTSKIVSNVTVLPARKEQDFDFSRDSPPGLGALLIYIFKASYRIGRKFLRRAFNIKQKWSLALSNRSWVDANERNAIRLEPPRGKFWADPFLFKEDGQLYCFIEEYDYKIKKGHISVLSIENEKVLEVGRCIEKTFHLSFPYIFRYDGHIYMCPEASESNEITIYRSQVFPLKWATHSTAMTGISAADTMIFEYAGKWWMFTNIDASGTHDYCSALHIFHSETPINCNWTAHAMNPIIVDCRGGRNGGLIIQDGRIFRGAQVQGYDQYGQGIIVSEIVLLNELQYAEAECKEFGPCRRRGLVGVHHISSTGDMTVIDQLSNRFRA